LGATSQSRDGQAFHWFDETGLSFWKDDQAITAWPHDLDRERPAQNLIRDSYLEMIGAVDAVDRLVAYLFADTGDSNVNLLFGFTGWAFHRHHNIVFVRH
jgi:hypothetical protein